MSKKGGYKHVPDTKAHINSLHFKEWREEYVEILKKQMTVTDWQNEKVISNADMLAYPNARTAYDIIHSPLMKALL